MQQQLAFKPLSDNNANPTLQLRFTNYRDIKNRVKLAQNINFSDLIIDEGQQTPKLW